MTSSRDDLDRREALKLLAIRARVKRHADRAADGHREDREAAVVDVLADEVHAAGRARDRRAQMRRGYELAHGAKNSLIAGAVAAAPGNGGIPSASSVSRSVLWC